jgi:hypothetical protein
MNTIAGGLMRLASACLAVSLANAADFPSGTNLLAQYAKALESLRSIQLKAEVRTEYEKEKEKVSVLTIDSDGFWVSLAAWHASSAFNTRVRSITS